MRNAIIAPGRHGAPGGKSVVADEYNSLLNKINKTKKTINILLDVIGEDRLGQRVYIVL